MKNDGGPAFPAVNETGHDGLTLRDYFAGKVIVGIWSNMGEAMMSGFNKASDEKVNEGMKSLVSIAYTVADYMLEARKQERP